MQKIKKHKIKGKHIEIFLQDIDDFEYGEKDKLSLEQHMTPPFIAAKLLQRIMGDQILQESIVADFGTGTGMLICGLLYVGAQHAIGIQIDEKYIYKTQQLLRQKVDGASYQLIQANIKQLNLRQKSIDIVVMNPPFGTKQQGIDIQFLKLAFKVCKGNIYSMHKTSTRAYLQKFCKNHGYLFYIIQKIQFPLKKRFKNYHKKDIAFTQVDIIKLIPITNQIPLQQ